MTEATVRDAFVALMVHDLGKMVLLNDGRWTGHQNLRPEDSAAFATGDLTATDMEQLLGEDVYREVQEHHKRENTNPNLNLVTPLAVVIADRVQKAMYQLRDSAGNIVDETNRQTFPPALNDLRAYPPFYPYYGSIVQQWQARPALDLLDAVVKTLKNDPALTMPTLLEAQRSLRCYPHTTYMPHLSLELHHRFAATLFLLIYKQLQRVGRPYSQLDAVRFAVVTALPDPLELFYRLRDVKAYRQAAIDLRQDLYTKVFQADCRDIPGADAAHNPFEYYTGDGLIFIYDAAEALLAQIQQAADRRQALRSLAVETIEYTIPLSWGNNKLGPVRPTHRPDVRRQMVLERHSQTFPGVTLERCRRCNVPVDDPAPSGLCSTCQTLMAGGGLLDLEKVARGSDGNAQRLAYLFITLPENLREHAQSVGQALLQQALTARDVAFALQSTELGLFEYLEAVLAVDSYQRDIVERTERAGLTVYPIARFHRLAIYVMREDQFLDFFEVVDGALAQLRLAAGVRAILCGLKTPVWSLMDRFAGYEDEQRVLVDTAGGAMVMFTDDEVKAIRELAEFPNGVISRAQLQALITMARKGSLEELKLEIDRRRNKNKIKGQGEQDFARVLKERLAALKLTDNAAQDREKRALFIKNIADLGNFKAQ